MIKSKLFLLFRYLLVAGFAYSIDFGGFILLIYFKYPPILSNIIVKIVAAIFGFYSHRYFTYSIKDKANIAHHALKYFGLALIYVPVSSGALYLCMLLISNPLLAKFITDVILFILIFFITSKFTFSKGKASKEVTLPFQNHIGINK
jgi:putative flippase GtrA